MTEECIPWSRGRRRKGVSTLSGTEDQSVVGEGKGPQLCPDRMGVRTIKTVVSPVLGTEGVRRLNWSNARTKVSEVRTITSREA